VISKPYLNSAAREHRGNGEPFQDIEMTLYKAKYEMINPVQVVVSED